MREYVIGVIVGFLIDFFVGDPQGWWHPVRTIGWMITKFETFYRKIFPKTPKGELAAGFAMTVSVIIVSVGATGAALWLTGMISPLLRFLFICIISSQLLAARSLYKESMVVYDRLKAGDVEGARQAVSMIVGRDTKSLSEEGIIKAAVETVAENTSDGVIAPMMWMLVLGPIGGIFYKAVNTMDSMVGYKNDKYLYFGRVSAKLDDVVNWLPARVTALSFVIAAFLLPGCDEKEAFRIWRRDRHCHKSPNSAQSEAACAGALGICLAGDAYYFGVLHHKPTIGDEIKPVEMKDIYNANQLMYIASLLVLIIGTGGVLWII